MPRSKPGSLKPPKAGVTVRMYRQGHGDCFLICAAKEDGGPFFMVIDCGLWPGSECDDEVTMKEVVADIAASTGGKVDVLVITHEHMDHVSGFAAPRGAAEGSFHWDAIKVDELWLAWTEDGRDPDAIALRERFDDVLLGLATVAGDPVAFGLEDDGGQAQLIRDVLALHTGDDDFVRMAKAARGRRAASGTDQKEREGVPGLSNKAAIRRMRRKAGSVHFLSPGKAPYGLPGMGERLRAYALGPPRDARLLLSLDPVGTEEFRYGLDGASTSLLGALASDSDGARAGNPFSPRFGAPPQLLGDSDADFFTTYYGRKSDPSHPNAWRAIDGEWAGCAEGLALRLNDEVNNTSLVLALEMPRSGKVLLFAGDAQRGSWISWGRLEWSVGGRPVTARDLLGRTVLYKVGHHGSHNATLHGRAGDDFANLEWLGQREYAASFVAFIPANKRWADAKKPRAWKHPLQAIEERLIEKADGRVFRMDRAEMPSRPPGIGDAAWKRFESEASVNRMYAQYTVADRPT